MVVIFGFGAGSPEDQGEVAPCVCPNCHNQVFLHHIRSKKSVRLYFVPVVPYGTDNYLVCPVCSRGLQVSDAQLRHVRSMSSATASFRAGRLSQDRYMYGTDNYLVCPVCSRGLQVSDAQLRHVRSMSSATASFRAGRLSQDRYMAQAERFWRQLGVNPAGQQVSTPASPGAPVPVQPAASVRSAAPAPPPAADDRTSWVSQLHQLAQLHDQGVLSDAAYAAAKRRILEQER